MDLSKRNALGNPMGAHGSRILNADTGNRKPNLRIRCTLLNALGSAAGRMRVLPLLQTAQVAEAGSRLRDSLLLALRVSAWAP